MAVLADRVALVTGASSGIGAGLAAMLADEGARVVLAAWRGEELERVAAGIRLDYSVKLGPEILIRTMRNPMAT
jgi:NADP-dependent 3-hydroxy acid dehydrogenase YdfG